MGMFLGLKQKVDGYSALRYEMNISFVFRREMCCPIVHLFSDYEDRYHNIDKFYHGHNDCLLNINTETQVFWFKSTTFILPNYTQDSGKCQLNSGNYTCNISTANLNYEPKQRWLTLGHLCGEQKNLSGLQYHYSINVKNTTECELMQTPQTAKDFYLQCNQFYDYINFPNIFGHQSKTEAFAILLPFKSIFENLDQPCYKHLDYTLCQAFLPCCPKGTNEDNKIVSHLDVMCEQMCWDIVNACSTMLQPVINFIDCSYYIRISDINCIYKPVFCNLPPSIQNGHIIMDGHQKTVGSTVKYSCDNDYKLVGNSTVVCLYSGSWKRDVICKSTKNYVTYIIIDATSGVVLLLLPIIGLFM